MERFSLKRRHFLQRSASAALLMVRTSFQKPHGANNAVDEEPFEEILQQFQTDTSLAEPMRSKVALAESFRAGLEKAPIRTQKSSSVISTRASDLIVACEVSSKAAYVSHYSSPVWPGGVSGITIGVGYDVGYATPSDLQEDWVHFLESKFINVLSTACGATGTRAHTVLGQLPSFSISWDIAQHQYSTEIRPRYIGLTESALRNTANLSPDSLGALVSVVYNRGPSFQLPGPQYQEMRNIFRDMASREFSKIPSEIRRMKRLWEDQPNLRGLVLRREAEANLFELGLQAS